MAKDKQSILVEAYVKRAGDPKFPNFRNLDLARVKKMNGTEADAKDLIRSYQNSDENYNGLVLAFHKRIPNFDGEIGPATEALADIRMDPKLACPMPDFPLPPGATFDTGDPELNAAIESQQRAEAMGSGSWPSCDPTRLGVNSFRVNLAMANIPGTVKAYLDKALEAVVKAYAETGCALRYVKDGDATECEISKKFQNLSGSVIGWNEFPNPGTCNQVINGRLDTGYAPSDYRYWANLECHETGHGVGLQHTRGHIMNPSILLVWPLSWFGGPSESVMRRYFGGVAVPTGGDPPPPPPPGDRVWFKGSFELLKGEQSLGQFIIAPKPQV